jgi:membrane protein YdbS with pleckstrin-like domain
MEECKKEYNKWKSRRWLITVWAMLVVTGLGLYSIFTGYSEAWLSGAFPLLIAIPSVFIVGDSYSKK